MTAATVVVVVLIGAMQLACIAKLLPKIREKCRSRSCAALVKSLFNTSFEEEEVESPHFRKVCAEFGKLLALRRVKIAMSATFGLWVASCVLGVPVVMDVLTEDSTILAASGMNIFLRIAVMVLLTVPSLIPKAMEIRFVPNSVYMLLMTCFCAMTFSPRHACMDETYAEMVLSAVLVSSGCATRTDLIIGSNVVFLVCQILSTRGVLGQGDVEAQLKHGYVLLFTLRLVMIWCADAALKWVTWNVVTARHDLRQQSAVSALLDMTCDAVIDLDRDLRFDDHFPKLAGMLMHGHGKSLQGKLLFDFVHGEDEIARVKVELCRSSVGEEEQQPAPGMTTALLRDAIGNKIKTTFMHVPYNSIDGSLRHLIGVREEADEFGAKLEEKKHRAVLRPEVSEGLKRLGISATMRSADSKRSRSSGSSSSASRRASEENTNFDCNAEVCMSKSFPLHWVSETFQSEFGFPPVLDDDDKPGELGSVMPDGGAAMLCAMLAAVAKQKKRSEVGQFTKHLGEFEFSTKLGGTASELRAVATRRSVWMHFNLPMHQNNFGVNVAAIAVSWQGSHSAEGEGPAAPTLKGTAPSLTPELLAPQGRPGALAL